MAKKKYIVKKPCVIYDTTGKTIVNEKTSQAKLERFFLKGHNCVGVILEELTKKDKDKGEVEGEN